MSALGYSLGEASASIWRRRGSSLLAVLTIGIALFVLGLFLLVNVNVRQWTGRWTEAAEVSVYLADGVSAAERDAIRALLARDPAVGATEFISSEEAGRRFARLFPELARAAAGLGPGALPASFEVRLASRDSASAPAVDRVVAALRRTPGVADVRYDRRWLDRLEAAVRLARSAGAALAAVLVLAAALTVASVVRLALHARRQEIEIMHLVGAPLAYIRGPFVLEGVLQGGLGAVLALVVLLAAYTGARFQVDAAAAALPGLAVAPLAFLPVAWVMALVAGGMIVGCAGGLIAARATRAF